MPKDKSFSLDASMTHVSDKNAKKLILLASLSGLPLPYFDVLLTEN